MNSGHQPRPRPRSRQPRTASRPRSQSTTIPGPRHEQPAPSCAPRYGASPSPAAGKSKRVRTGCLTCRERHLKCDEGVPECNNCQKSNRQCRRGIRLNFIDIQVRDPPCLPSAADWSFQILDESRLIAAEYQGGLGRYAETALSPSRGGANAPPSLRTGPGDLQAASVLPKASINKDGLGVRDVAHSDDNGHLLPDGQTDRRDRVLPPARRPLLTAPSAPGPQLNFSAPPWNGSALALLRAQDAAKEPAHHALNFRIGDELTAISPLLPQSPMLPAIALRPDGSDQRFGTPSGLRTPSSENTTGERDYLDTEEEVHLMQVFIEEVAVWMDALDKDKHFANTVPYLALKLPMVFNALLACGAQHLALTGAQGGEKADCYYGTAYTQLLRAQQERDRDLSECALTAVVLNAYDIMNDKPAQRMGHIASTRALLRECGWDASSGGLGAACFWVNVGMEVLSCISFGWPTAWEPDQWGLDLEFAALGAASRSGSRSVGGGDDIWRVRADSVVGSHVAELGGEELWVHRIFYIMAKAANFRANTPQFQEPSPHDEQVRLQARFAEWRRLQNMCNAWNLNCPRSMRPYGYSPGPSAQSLFPNVWLIKPPAKLGRLLYHTSMCLLAQTNPLAARDSRENGAAGLHHAHHVCGIVAHARGDRGVASLAVRCLAVAAAALTDRREQEEVLDLLDRVGRETGWRLGRVVDELRGAWGWEAVASSAAVLMGLAALPGVSGSPVAKLQYDVGSGLRGEAGEGHGRGASDWG